MNNEIIFLLQQLDQSKLLERVITIDEQLIFDPREWSDEQLFEAVMKGYK